MLYFVADCDLLVADVAPSLYHVQSDGTGSSIVSMSDIPIDITFDPVNNVVAWIDEPVTVYKNTWVPGSAWDGATVEDVYPAASEPLLSIAADATHELFIVSQYNVGIISFSFIGLSQGDIIYDGRSMVGIALDTAAG